MLALSRKARQDIVLSNGVRIVVVRISGSKVTLGIEAPDHVTILRGEVEPKAELQLVSPTATSQSSNHSCSST